MGPVLIALVIVLAVVLAAIAIVAVRNGVDHSSPDAWPPPQGVDIPSARDGSDTVMEADGAAPRIAQQRVADDSPARAEQSNGS